MERMARWGMTLPLHGFGLAEQREIVTELDSLGYTDAWSAELNGIDALLRSPWPVSGPASCGWVPRSPVSTRAGPPCSR